MIARAKEFTAQGLKAIKMQVAHIRPWREDVQNVKAMREAMGGGIEIMIDVNMGWDADTAIQAGHRIDEFDPYWLEEPVIAEDFAGYRRIAAALKTRIVGGESHFTRNDLRPFFETPCVPILQPDPMRGGYTELRKIAAAAEPWGIRLAPHLFHETMVHVLAAIPNASYLEYMDWNDDLWIEPVLPSKDGTMTPARTAGPWPRLPAGDPEGLPHRRAEDDVMAQARLLAIALLGIMPQRCPPSHSRRRSRSPVGTRVGATRRRLCSPTRPSRSITVTDPVYRRPMTYRAMPLAAAAERHRDRRGRLPAGARHRQFLGQHPAAVSPLPTRRRSKAFSPSRTPAAPWPPIPGKPDKASAGPFYIVWRLAPPARVSSEYWAYRLAALAVTDSPLKRWPGLAVGADVPAGDPVRIGLDRFVALCMACHRFNGAGRGRTGTRSRPADESRRLPADPRRSGRLIRNPASVRKWPDQKMPGFEKITLSDSDLDAIIAWLTYKARQHALEAPERRLGEALGRRRIELHEQGRLQHLDLDHDQRTVAHHAVDAGIERQLGQRAQRGRALLRHLARRRLGGCAWRRSAS